ncbi:MAG: VRR-NUC domain-containing protein [Clostridia bacterium]|nr:VRR-NUC domain-containing protein [Clostridia bacterium]
MTETDIMNNIRLELSERGYYTERTNVGKGYLVPTDVWNRIKHLIPESEQKKIRYFSTGAMVGRSDLSAIKDGKISFIEVKTDKGKPTKEQLNFIKVMKERYGCNAGIARSPEEAINLVSTGT